MSTEDDKAKAKRALDDWLAMVYRMVRAQMSREAMNAARHEAQRKRQDNQ